MDGVTLVQTLNAVGGRARRRAHRIIVEDRLVGIKSREIYEAPAAMTLHSAHEALEQMTLSKQQLRMKHALAAGVRGPDLQRALVHGAPPGPGALRAEHAAARQRRRCACGCTRGRRSPSGARRRAACTATRSRRTTDGDQYDQSVGGRVHQDLGLAGSTASTRPTAGGRRAAVPARYGRGRRQGRVVLCSQRARSITPARRPACLPWAS